MRTILLLIFLLSFTTAWGQGYVVLLPDEVSKPYYARRDAIENQLDTSTANEWAGRYSIHVGETWSEAFLWAPNFGFATFRDTCSYGPRAWVNHGSVTVGDTGLRLLSDRPEGADFLLSFDEPELVFVRWDEQHWLVPKKDLAVFAYAVNSRSGIEYEIGYRKSGDGDKRRRGDPDLPLEFKRLLDLPPVKAKVVAIHKAEDDWLPNLTIDAGRDKKVIEGMNFWLTGQKNIRVRVRVIQVGERTSKVEVRSFGQTGDFDKEVVSKIGWRFFSRDPDRGR